LTPEQHALEVLNMLNQEWNTQTYGEVRFREGFQQGFRQAMQEEAELYSYETARILFEMNLSLEQIAKGSQLPLEKVRELYQSGALANPANQTKRS
jgi:hypothetical protein